MIFPQLVEYFSLLRRLENIEGDFTLQDGKKNFKVLYLCGIKVDTSNIKTYQLYKIFVSQNNVILIPFAQMIMKEIQNI